MKMFYVFMFFCKLHYSQIYDLCVGNKETNKWGKYFFFSVLSLNEKNYRTQWSKTGRQWGAQKYFIEVTTYYQPNTKQQTKTVVLYTISSITQCEIIILNIYIFLSTTLCKVGFSSISMQIYAKLHIVFTFNCVICWITGCWYIMYCAKKRTLLSLLWCERCIIVAFLSAFNWIYS